MTFTASMAKLVAKHRFLAYALATLFVAVFTVIFIAPSAIAAGAVPDLSTYANATKGECRYLTFCRWDNLSAVGQPPITDMPMVFVTDALFSIGHFAFFLIGQTILFLSKINIYNGLLYWGDGVFASAGNIISSTGVGGVLGYVFIAVLLVVLYFFIAPSFVKKMGSKSPIHGSVMIIAGLLIFFIMSTNSAKNHGTGATSTIGKSMAGSVVSEPSERLGDKANMAATPSNWQTLSLGWTVSTTNQIVGGVVNVAETLLVSLTKSLNIEGDGAGEASSCDIYIDSMHNLYGGSESVIALEQLYRVTVLDQYINANYGTSVGAQNAWCRVLELGEPVGDQVVIAHNAQQFTDTAKPLYYTALQAIVENPEATTKELAWRNLDKEAIDGNESFKGDTFGAGLATSLFGPPKIGGVDNSHSAHLNYFAACLDKGEAGMKLNPEWIGVMSADRGTGNSSIALTDATCQGVVTGTKDDSDKGVAFGFLKDASDPEGENHGRSDLIKRWSYGNSDEGIMSLLFAGGADASDRFVAADGGLGGKAHNYYSLSSGTELGPSLLSGSIMVIVVFFVWKIAFPVVIGGVVAEFLAAAAMGMLAFTLLALAVWPSPKVRGLNLKVFGVVIAGSIVNALYTAIFLVYAAMFTFTTSVMTIRSADAINSYTSAIGLLLSALISYSMMKMLLKKALNFDVTNMRESAKMAASSVAAPMRGKMETASLDTLAAPFRNAKDFFKTPVTDAQSSWSNLRKAGDSVKTGASDILNRKKTSQASANTPQGATSTKNQKANGLGDPIVSFLKDGKPGATNAGAGATATANAGGAGLGNRSDVGASSVSDEQQRQRLLDQIKSAYGTSKMDQVFPTGLPADFEKTIANAPLSEIKKLAEELKSGVEGSKAPRASQDQAAANMEKFKTMGAETLRANPSGFDPSVGYAERAATQAQLFRSANPMNENDLNKLSDSERSEYNARKFDVVGEVIPDGKSASFDRRASEVIKGEVVLDPLTDREVPNSIVRSGSQNLAPIEGVTQNGKSIYGAKRNENGGESWDVETLNSGSRQLSPSMFSDSNVSPQGVTPEQWNDVNDIHGWIKDNGMKVDSTSMASWPEERREQAERVAPVMANIMKSRGVPVVEPENLESIADSGVGVTSDDTSFAFGEKTPKASFEPATLRQALSDGSKKIEELKSDSAKRTELMISQNADTKLSAIESSLKSKEGALREKLAERVSLESANATAHLDSLIEELGKTNAEIADKVSDLIRDGKWEEILEIMDESADLEGDDESVDILRDEIRDVVETSQGNIKTLNEDHSYNVARLYSQLSEEREDVIERMHRDIESDLEIDIARHIDGLGEVAFEGASDTSRRHVEGMLHWFPAIKNRFFSGNRSEDVDDVVDADADGIDDRIQETV